MAEMATYVLFMVHTDTDTDDDDDNDKDDDNDDTLISPPLAVPTRVLEHLLLHV